MPTSRENTAIVSSFWLTLAEGAWAQQPFTLQAASIIIVVNVKNMD